jgi:hypothetical protein
MELVILTQQEQVVVLLDLIRLLMMLLIVIKHQVGLKLQLAEQTIMFRLGLKPNNI